MRSSILILISCLTSSLSFAADYRTTGKDDRLFFLEPARIWEETLPLGNGRLGMMPDGGIEHERIVLNEISMWSGCEADYRNPEASKSLPEIRRLLAEGKNAEAQELMYRSFVPKKETSDPRYGMYQILANLDIDYNCPSAAPDSYIRELLLDEGISRTSFSADGVRFTRKYYVSRDADIMVIQIEADRTGALEFTASMSRPAKGYSYVKTIGTRRHDRMEISVLEGNLESGTKGVDGISYVSAMWLEGDKGSQKTLDKDGKLHFKGTKATLLVSAATSFEADGTDFPGKRYKAFCDSILLSAGKELKYTGSAKMEEKHIALHSGLYDRTSIKLPSSPDDTLPADKRLEHFSESSNPSPSMATLYWNYGKYLFISSTRPGSLPPNLQGLWANDISTPWNGDYHTNINLQMNYWPMERWGLREFISPLAGLIERMIPSGKESAKCFYGDSAKGWVLHMMTNVWNYTAPGENPSWGATNTGGAWLCEHLWNHYIYTKELSYLRKVYPAMKGASEFFLSTLVEEPAHKWLVTSPSSSPENEFWCEGHPVSICMGPTMDIQLLAGLFSHTAEAAHILGIDNDLADSLETAVLRFPPMQISPDGGYLQEWLEDYKEVDPHHRHVSHLYGLHPGDMISRNRTPDLAEACKRTLERRGDEGTGWSRAWKINFWARLGDGEHAWKLFRNLMVPALDKTTGETGSGTYPNLFCSHPPFQIDGNFGGSAGIGEMLLQSHEGFIHPLPAIPAAWDSGEVRGMHVPGNAIVDFSWEDMKLKELKITAEIPGNFTLKIPEGLMPRDLYGSEYPSDSSGFMHIGLEAGESAQIHFTSE